MNKNFHEGQEVRFTSVREHKKMSWCYPPAGWVGKILRVANDETALVDWGENSGVDKNVDRYAWWAAFCELETVDES